MSQKTLIYVDTSVWNFALETTRPDSIFTYEFLLLFKKDEYKAIISNVVKAEIDDAPEPRKNQLIELLKLTNAEILHASDETLNLAELYVKKELIPQEYINDAIHIAAATVNRCNFLVSWNFKHIVRAKVIMGVHHVNHAEGYGLIELVTPREVLGK